MAKKSVAKKSGGGRKSTAVKKASPRKKVVRKKKAPTKAKPRSKPSSKPARKSVTKKSAAKPRTKKKAVAKKKVTKRKVTKKKAAKKVAKKKVTKKKVANKATPKKGTSSRKKVATPIAKKKVTTRKSKARKTRVSASLPIDRKKHSEDLLDGPTPIIKKTHLSKSKLAMFRKLLQEYRDRYVDEIKFLSGGLLSSRESAGEASTCNRQMPDQGTDNFRRELNLSLVSSDHDILWEIDEAIKRVDRNTFGVCEITGEAIGLERLKAMPYTRHSIEAQEAIEQGKIKYRPFGSTLKHGR